LYFPEELASADAPPALVALPAAAAAASPACAFCVASPATLACGGCARRGYCGEACARADWSSGGQRHARWCALRCGEEGLEWAVRDCGAARGLGVVALVDIPEGARVLVDEALPRAHASLAEGPGGARRAAALALTPAENGGDLDVVFANNQYGGREGPVIGLRLSRVNHACDPSAAKVADDDLGVNVVCALRAIRAGEEVTISYLPCDDPSTDREPAAAREVLSGHYGILCPSDCRCRDERLAALMARARELDARVFALGGRCDTAGAVAAAEDLLALYDEARLPRLHMARARTLYDAFQVAVMRRARSAEAAGFLRRAREIHARSYHPESSAVTEYEELEGDPSRHGNFGAADEDD